jgi:hypothetical protein
MIFVRIRFNVNFQSFFKKLIHMKKIFISILCLLLATASFAANYYWVGATTGGNFSTSSNWSSTSGGAGGFITPVAGDGVIFDNGGTISVNYDLSTSVTNFSDFQVINNTQLILINTTTGTRTFGISGTAGNTYTVVAAGSSLTLSTTANTSLRFATAVGKCVFDGPVYCLNGTINTSAGPTLVTSATTDSIVINNLFYQGPITGGAGSNPQGTLYRFGASSVYQIDRNSGFTVAGKYAPTSLIRITGTSTTGPFLSSGSATQFGSVEVNAPSISAAVVSLGLGAGFTIQGYLKITNANGNAVRITSSSPLTILGDVIVNNGTLQISNSASAIVLNIGGKLVVDAGTTFDLGNGSGNNTANVAGDVAIAGTLNTSGANTTSTLVLNGTSAQNISIANITGPTNLRTNNAAGFTLGSNITMPNNANSKLTLTNGIINNPSNYTIYLQNGATTALVGGASTAYLNGGSFRRDIASGTAIGTTYFFPTGKSNRFRPVKLYPSASLTQLNTFEVAYFGNAYSTRVPTNPLYNVTFREYWTVARTAGTVEAFDLSLNTSDAVTSGFTAAQIPTIELGRFNTTLNTWDNLSNNSGNSTYGATGAEINTTGISASGIFTYVSQQTVIPIDIESFGGSKLATGNHLSWKIACTNFASAQMILERSTDGIAFKPIYEQTIKAAQCQERFTFMDANRSAGDYYYRLKVIEADEKPKYSRVVVLVDAAAKAFEVTNIGSNPVGQQATIALTSANAGVFNITVTDLAGRTLVSRLENILAASNYLSFDVASLSAGMYLLTATNEWGEKKTLRFVKN